MRSQDCALHYSASHGKKQFIHNVNGYRKEEKVSKLEKEKSTEAFKEYKKSKQNAKVFSP